MSRHAKLRAKKQPWPVRWRVRSGALSAVVRAEAAHEAFIAAVRAAKPKSLGAIAECESLDGPVEGDTFWYCSTERALKAAGMWGDETTLGGEGSPLRAPHEDGTP